MALKRNTGLTLLLLCSLALWVKSACAGSSFLSPSQRPQGKGKPPRVGRRATEEFTQPQEDKHITINAPFEMGITMSDEEFQEYGVVLQNILQNLLGDTDRLFFEEQKEGKDLIKGSKGLNMNL